MSWEKTKSGVARPLLCLLATGEAMGLAMMGAVRLRVAAGEATLGGMSVWMVAAQDFFSCFTLYKHDETRVH
jgi:hypothetical protein